MSDVDSSIDLTAPKGPSRLDLFEHCKLAELAKRYDDMVSLIKELVKIEDLEITSDERNLFSVAYNNAIGTKRLAWRTVYGLLEKVPEGSAFDDKRKVVKDYLEKIRAELCETMQEAIDLVDIGVLPTTFEMESRIYFIKLKADYFRYMAEVSEGDERQKAIESAHLPYAEAYDMAIENLVATHPVRLGLALNYSVFYHECREDKIQATAIARYAFDGAICELHTLSEASYEDSTVILQLIRDNLTLWSDEMQLQNILEADQLAELIGAQTLDEDEDALDMPDEGHYEYGEGDDIYDPHFDTTSDDEDA